MADLARTHESPGKARLARIGAVAALIRPARAWHLVAMSALPPQLLQFLGSLVAILALAWVAKRLGLGPSPTLADEAAARTAFDHALPGFVAQELAIDRDGHGAIARDRLGRILVLRPHGTHFAGRLLGPGAQAQEDGGALVVDTADRRFGAARLALSDPSAWVKAIDAMKAQHNA